MPLQENKSASTFSQGRMASIGMSVSFCCAVARVWHASQSPASCLILATIPGQKTHSRARRTCGTITHSPLKIRPWWTACSSRIENYDAMSGFTSALLSGEPARMVCFSVYMGQSSAIAVWRRLMVDCPIGKCSTALICENCSHLSATYALDSVSAMWICLLVVYFTTMSYCNRRSSIPWIRLGALHSGFLTIVSRGL